MLGATSFSDHDPEVDYIAVEDRPQKMEVICAYNYKDYKDKNISAYYYSHSS